MNKRNKKKLLAILHHYDRTIVTLAKHTQKHCLMIADLTERVARMESALGEQESMAKKKGLN